MTDSVFLLKLIPNLILLFGVVYLFWKRKFNVILFTLFSFLLMEASPFFADMKKYTFSMFFVTSGVYFLLVHKVYSDFLEKKTKQFLKIGIPFFIFLSIMFLMKLFKGDDFQVISHNIMMNIVFIAYPVLYLTQVLKQKNKYNELYFRMSCVFLSYFIFEIILSVLLGFIFKIQLTWKFYILPFRFFIIQIFYISLIYFGWKIGKTQKG